MKTADEIKKGLETCRADECHGQHTDCPYHPDLMCIRNICADALALIKQLEAERDALKEALGLMVYQYCVRGDKLDHLYMCAGETAFRVLGLEQYGNTSSLESWLFPEYQAKEE